jgi:hypothetical protein
MSPVGFEPTIPATYLLQTHALGGAATGIGIHQELGIKYNVTQNLCSVE